MGKKWKLRLERDNSDDTVFVAKFYLNLFLISMIVNGLLLLVILLKYL